MSTYRKEWPCCGDVTETQAWEPQECPFCTPAATLTQHEPVAWRALSDHKPEPEVFVLTWDGQRVGIDWWGSLRYRRGDTTTHWCPFPKPPGAGEKSMYGMHSLAEFQPAHRESAK